MTQLENRLVEAALEAGAAKAAVIRQSQIVLSADFRKICEGNGCGNYGRCWACPPFRGDIQANMQEIRSFSKGMIYQSIGRIEDSFDIEGMAACAGEHAQLSQRLGQRLRPLLPGRTLHLSCGGCRLCPRCACADGQPCRQPDRALGSLEGYGVDVYLTVRDTPLKYCNGPDTVTFFGMVLWGE